jgi:hypothetical protein
MNGMPSGKVVVQDGAAHRRVDELRAPVNRLGVNDVLIVVRGGQVDHFAGVAQTDRGERFHCARFERQQHFFDVGESAAFALGAGLALVR